MPTAAVPDPTDAAAIDEFIDYWGDKVGSERSNYTVFFNKLCPLLGVPTPEASTGTPAKDNYVIDKPVTFRHGDGSTSTGYIDLYKRGCFVCETKQGIEKKRAQSAADALANNQTPAPDARPTRRGHGVRGTKAWDSAMMEARGQAEGYVRALPDDNPPFIVVMDVGYTIELYADFSRLGKVYTPFPDAQSHRLKIDQLRDPLIRERLRLLWTDPLALDPSRKSAKVTREIADQLAQLSKSLEKQGHHPEHAAHFLMRCLFTLFAEDVGLLPKGRFTDLLKELQDAPDRFPHEMTGIWRAMNVGDYSPSLKAKLLKFNGGLFEHSEALDLNGSQIRILHEAATKGWEHVEPAIFGTLLERALNVDERHKLGAHFTPRAYVERLVVPTIIEPLREDLEAARAAALAIASRPIPEDLQSNRRDKYVADQMREAREPIYAFLRALCQVTVLDPACGTGNFLYVAMAKMKDLEGEAGDLLRQLGDDQYAAEQLGLTVDPHQFLGIEINPRAVAIADLVLWIGYLQWHFRTHGNTPPREPVLKRFDNIKEGDAVLAYDKKELVTDEHGKPITRWDGKTMKKHPVTGEDVPDESARVPVYRYVNPRKAEWPKADYVVGNPPFIGNKRMRELLGDSYVTALRATHSETPGSADLVMFWWSHAVEHVLGSQMKRAGFITTNSITQTLNRPVLEKLVAEGGSIAYAIPDHPWVDSADGADVRVALAVAQKGMRTGRVLSVLEERADVDGEYKFEVTEVVGKVHPDLTTGVELALAVPLYSNASLCLQGVIPLGQGFILDPKRASDFLAARPTLVKHIRRYRNGKDLSQRSREAWVIDLEGLEEPQVRSSFPEVYQHVLQTVKPERDQNRERYRRENWWKFGRKHTDLREGIAGLTRYVVTVKTAKHRIFMFIEGDIVPDSKLYAIALDDAAVLGALSSRVHVLWATTVGGWLGVGNDPTYNSRDCFDKFPFPAPTDAQKARIRDLGEQLDAHRKRQQAAHPGLTITDMYNVLEKLRGMGVPPMNTGGTPVPQPDLALSPKEKKIHEQGLVSVLRQIHDELDAAVFEAYGWPATLTDEQILERLVALNAERAAEEKRGIIRWLRPDFQQARARGRDGAGDDANERDAEDEGEDAKAEQAADVAPARKRKRSTKAAAAVAAPKAKKAKVAKRPWPATMAEQARAIREALAADGGTAQTPADLAKRFTRANADRIAELLDTLATLGQARRDGDSYRAS